MSTHLASVNGSTQDSASATRPAVRAPRTKRVFRREQETDAGWALRMDAETASRRQAASARRDKSRAASKARALRIAPAVAERVATARARLEERYAAAVAANQAITAKLWPWIEFQAGLGNADAKLVVAADAAPLHADRRRARAALVRADVAVRLGRGYEWKGGGVGGNDGYARDAFRYDGLVSDEHPILQHFVSKLPRARHLRVADSKAETYSVESKLIGADSAYIEANKKMVGVLRVELDVTVELPALRAACDRLQVPQPNIVVGWQDADMAFVRPHLLWLLHDSVPVAGPLCGRFLSVYRGVSRGLTKALLSIGADVGGLANLHRHKNPLSPLWDRAVLVQQPYDLGDLREHVDITVRMKTLHEMAAELRGDAAPGPAADHPAPEVAAQSNRLFSHLSGWARTAVVAHRAAGGERAEFDIVVAEEAYRFAAGLSGGAAAGEKAALRCARSVAAWTWTEYRAPKPKAAPLAGQALTERHSAGGRVAAEKRRARSEDVIVAAALKLAADGVVPTQVEVLAAVAEAGIRGEKTVRRHWAAVLAAVACQQTARSFAGVSVKENISPFGSLDEVLAEDVLPTTGVLRPTLEDRPGQRPSASVVLPCRPRSAVPAFLRSGYRVSDPAGAACPMSVALPKDLATSA